MVPSLQSTDILLIPTNCVFPPFVSSIVFWYCLLYYEGSFIHIFQSTTFPPESPIHQYEICANLVCAYLVHNMWRFLAFCLFVCLLENSYIETLYLAPFYSTLKKISFSSIFYKDTGWRRAWNHLVPLM